MEKIVRCADAGLKCAFEAHGQTDRELLELYIQHVQLVHGMDENPVELAERIASASGARTQSQAEANTNRRRAA